jgi:hypothetical protein
MIYWMAETVALHHSCLGVTGGLEKWFTKHDKHDLVGVLAI